MRRLNILTWHTHGSYLYYLSQTPHEFHVLSKPGRPTGYGGRCGPFPFGPNVHELPVAQAREREFDCILLQEYHHWERDQYEFLPPAQRALPRIYLEHDPPGTAGGAMRAELPLDLLGTGAFELGGLGEIDHPAHATTELTQPQELA